MKVNSQAGTINVLLVPLILAVLFFIGAAAFGYWAFMSRQDYKNNADQKVAAAVAIAKQQQSSTDQASFTQAEKNPLRTYTGPEAYGSLNVSYPKTWSAYVAEQDNSNTPLDGYFYPGAVPDVSNQNSSFALRISVLQEAYSQVLSDFQSQVQAGQVKVTPYALPKVPSDVGSRVTGQIAQNKQGDIVILPMRDKTIEIWTEAQQFEGDFNNNILPNVTFSP